MCTGRGRKRTFERLISSNLAKELDGKELVKNSFSILSRTQLVHLNGKSSNAQNWTIEVLLHSMVIEEKSEQPLFALVFQCVILSSETY